MIAKKYVIDVRPEYHKRHAARLLIDNSGDCLHLFFILAKGSIDRSDLSNFVRRDSRNTSDVLRTGEEQPRRIKFVRQDSMHPSKSQAIELEAHIKLCTLIHAEAVVKLEANVLCMHLMNTPLVPGTAVGSGLCICTTDKNEVAN